MARSTARARPARTRTQVRPLIQPHQVVTMESLIKWLALGILTALLVIGLMKGMLSLAVYLIKTLPMSYVS